MSCLEFFRDIEGEQFIKIEKYNVGLFLKIANDFRGSRLEACWDLGS